MPTYEVATTLAAGIATAAGYMTMNTTAARRAQLREIGLINGSAVQSSIGEGIPANTPVATTTIIPQAKDAADATSTALLGTAWSTPPTAPSVFRRQTVLGAAIGSSMIWKFALDERTALAKSTWETLWNFSALTSGILTSYYEYDE